MGMTDCVAEKSADGWGKAGVEEEWFGFGTTEGAEGIMVDESPENIKLRKTPNAEGKREMHGF